MENLRLLENVAEGANFSVEGPLLSAEFELFGTTIQLSESVVVEWVVVVILGVLFFVLGRNLKVKPTSKRQVIAEMLVGMFDGMVMTSMGPKYRRYMPYIGALFMFSITSSLMGLIGLRAPTADISVVGTWGMLTFLLVTFNRFKTGGVKGYLTAYVSPIPFMLPFNIIGEVMNPVSQSLRHFANIVSGMVISGLVYYAMGHFAVGLPAVLSLYTDLFSSAVQAYIFTTLTMSYISMAECE